ncbi:hypothetical protein FKW77_000621 [Venturia effusa]|uniref:Uncharacterized protein n=1 Tax=Venturia effusa TaxID=50376 RepID=A0A517LJK3_9PEZI|nr:hypothetical protein FKW77_000621 [Venturia effusa]
MDPLTAIGGLAATAQIAGGILLITQKLNDARKRYKASDTTIRLLIAELLSIKAAVGQIEDWAKYNSEECTMPRELVKAFEVSFEACHLAMEILAEQVAKLVSNNPFVVKAGVAWNEATMKDHAERMRSQVSALQLLIQAVRCGNPRQQKDLLETPQSQSIIRQIVDDTSTIRAIRGRSEMGSGPPTITSNRGSTIGSTIFDMDPELERTPPYQRAKKHHQSKSFDAQAENPFRKDDQSTSIARPSMPSRPPPTTPTIVTTSSEESKVDSGYRSIYDHDADLVNPVRYRETITKVKAPHGGDKSIGRSVSDPVARPSDGAQEHQSEDQLTPMERFRFKPPPSTFDPIESHHGLRPTRHVSLSEPAVYRHSPKLPNEAPKRSPWGTLKRLTSRAALTPSITSPLSPGAASNSSLRLSLPKTVKRRSESNIHQSIDFASQDGLSAPPLVRAAQSGSRVEINRLLEQRVDGINARHVQSGKTALAVAAHCGNDDVVAVLLHYDAEVNSPDVFGMTPLHLSASRGHYKVMEYLLGNHADVDACTLDGRTPLRLACDGGHLPCIELLLAYRAKVNARDEKKLTALMAAAIIGDVQIIELLVHNGADKEAKDASLRSAMHYAAENDYDGVVQKLLEFRTDIESIGPQSKTPLCCACASGSHQTAALLISRKANTRHQADNNNTPLHFASLYDRADTAELLLQQKRVVVDARNNEGQTPLHLAVINKSFSAAELLLRRGAAVEAVCHRNLRPIHHACDKSDHNMLGLLLGNGASIEAATHEGYRPIHFAAGRHGSEAVLSTLLRKGAQVDVRNTAGDRALCIAAARGHLSSVKVLLQNRSAVSLRLPKSPSFQDSPLCKAARSGYGEVVSELLRQGAAVNKSDETNWSPLRYAAYYGHPHVVEVLLMAGATLRRSKGLVENSYESINGVAQFNFAPGVSTANQAAVRQWLESAALRETTQPRRVEEHDPYLTISTANGGPVQEVYEVG